MEGKAKIGVFDSGFGGLSILKEIIKVLPQYDYVYLGDTARAPYGNRSHEFIYEFTKEGVEFLFEHGCNLVILACNSASADALHTLQLELIKGKNKYKRILGVIIPASEEVVRITKSKRVGVLGTVATITSKAFVREIHKLDKKIKVFGVPAPLLVPLIEEGEEKSKNAEILVKQYVTEIKKHSVDTIVLGCTHYEFLKSLIQKYTKNITLVSEGQVVAEKLKAYLERHKEIERVLACNQGRIFFTTDQVPKFELIGSRFFGQKIKASKTRLK